MNCSRCGQPVMLVYPEGARFAFFADADGTKHWQRCPPKERLHRPVPEPPAVNLEAIVDQLAAHFAATAIRVLAQTAWARAAPVRTGAPPAVPSADGGGRTPPAPEEKPRGSLSDTLGMSGGD